MSEATRQRWLHVKNRLEELARKHGPLDERPVVAWLDHLPEEIEQRIYGTTSKTTQEGATPTQRQQTAQQPSGPPPPQQRGVERSRRRVLDW